MPPQRHNASPASSSRRRPPAWALLALATAAHCAGLYVFSRGLLLTRLQLPDISTPEQQGLPWHRGGGDSGHGNGGAVPGRPLVRRVVVLMVDAMRADFLFSAPAPPRDDGQAGGWPNSASTSAEKPERPPAPWAGHMPALGRLLQEAVGGHSHARWEGEGPRVVGGTHVRRLLLLGLLGRAWGARTG